VTRETLTARDGVVRTIELETSPIVDGDRTSSAIWAFRDVTERERVDIGRRLLTDASKVLSAAFNGRLRLDDVGQFIIRDFADWCALDVVDPGRPALRRAVLVHRAAVSKPCTCDPESIPGRVVRAGRPELWAAADSGAWLLCAPLSTGGPILGAITLARQPANRRFDDVDLALVAELAARIAAAMENTSLYQRAQRAVQQRDEVLAVVSHDLRAPLSMVVLGAQLISRTLELLPEALVGAVPQLRKRAHAIERGAHRMNRLIDDLMDVARIDAGHLSIEPVRCRAAGLVGEAVDMFEECAQEAGIRLVVGPIVESLHVLGDCGRIVQLLSNLLGNAMRFTPRGGTITLGVDQPSAAEARFSVADTGPGIPTEQLPHLFERRWQGAEADRAGAGLGLYICQGIASALGGRIWVESTPGHGSSFLFTLPVAA
jgi:signal transduction histidine kinase